ncbi:hypothetical protein MKY34_21660 [Sporosarcina sp. FSL K6-1522]|uniref:hypothetical protein n=1 Tax=Sporosarcina sp. FSL K6-1522 TaxID=2921554 RepID=UPI00315A2E03
MLKKDLFYYILSKVLPLGLGIMFVPIVLNFLSVEEYGEYYTYNQYFVLINLIILSTTFYLQNNILEDEEIIYKVQYFTIILSVVVSIITHTFVFFLLGFENKNLLILITVALIFMGIYQNKMIILNVTGLSKVYFIGQLLFSFFKLVFVFLLMKVFFASSNMIFIGIILSLLVSILFLEKSNKTFNISFFFYDLNLFKKIFSFGFFVSFIVSIDIVLNFINITLANRYLSTTLLGVYTGWFSVFALIISMFTSIIYLPFISKIYNAKRENPLQLSKYFRKLYIYTLIINIVVIIFIMTFGSRIFNYFVPESYIEYLFPCIILIIGFSINSIIKIEVLKMQVINKVNIRTFIIFVVSIIIYSFGSLFFMKNDSLEVLIWQSVIGYIIFYLVLYLINNVAGKRMEKIDEH